MPNQAPPPPLTHLHIDPFSGIAGDMFLGALIDLGVSPDELRAALAPLKLADPYEIQAQHAQRCGIGGTDLRVLTTPTHHHDHDHGHHHHVGYSQIMAMIDQLDLTPLNRRRAQTIVTKLADAEARVHGVDRDKIHFHEVGAVDSIVDMLGSVIALQLLNIDTLSCGPVPISRGYVKCAHGLMPVPAPATAYLLENIPTVGVDRTGELVTPTGAALLAGLCQHFGPPPAMTLRAVGYGAGDREDPHVPNLLRLMLGTPTTPGTLGPTTPPTPPTLGSSFPQSPSQKNPAPSA